MVPYTVIKLTSILICIFSCVGVSNSISKYASTILSAESSEEIIGIAINDMQNKIVTSLIYNLFLS